MKRGGAYVYPVLVFAAAMLAGEACGQAETPAGSGGTCELTSDCQEGYVCITQPDGTRQCSNDLSSIQLSEEGGTEAGAMPMEAAAQDSGSPPKDTGSPPVDTGSPPQEAGGD